MKRFFRHSGYFFSISHFFVMLPFIFIFSENQEQSYYGSVFLLLFGFLLFFLFYFIQSLIKSFKLQVYYSFILLIFFSLLYTCIFQIFYQETSSFYHWQSIAGFCPLVISYYFFYEEKSKKIFISLFQWECFLLQIVLFTYILSYLNSIFITNSHFFNTSIPSLFHLYVSFMNNISFRMLICGLILSLFLTIKRLVKNR